MSASASGVSSTGCGVELQADSKATTTSLDVGGTGGISSGASHTRASGAGGDDYVFVQISG
ncbi:MAG: hypothetical protein ACJZ9F_03475 [Rhodospirillaceae bacterium]